jgi:hypothetical protein
MNLIANETNCKGVLGILFVVACRLSACLSACLLFLFDSLPSEQCAA